MKTILKKIEGNLTGYLVELEEDNDIGSTTPTNRALVLRDGGDRVYILCDEQDLLDRDLYDWHSDGYWVDKDMISNVATHKESVDFLRQVSKIKNFRKNGWDGTDYFVSARANLKFVKTLNPQKSIKVITKKMDWGGKRWLVVWDEREEEKVVDPHKEIYKKSQLKKFLDKLLTDDKVVKGSIRLYVVSKKIKPIEVVNRAVI